MVDEVDLDVADGTLFLNAMLTPQGMADWPVLLRLACERGNDVELAYELRSNQRMEQEWRRAKVNGGEYNVAVSNSAMAKIADSEFNNFYVRGLCLRALKDGRSGLLVYRAARVETPRPGSNAMIGSMVAPGLLLDRMRKLKSLEPALGLPPKPNSGLSLTLPLLDEQERVKTDHLELMEF